MTADEAQPGQREVWRVNHQRKGRMVIRVIDDPRGQDRFQADILDAKAAGLALTRKDRNAGAQELAALVGDVQELRCCFVDWVKKLEVQLI